MYLCMCVWMNVSERRFLNGGMNEWMNLFIYLCDLHQSMFFRVCICLTMTQASHHAWSRCKPPCFLVQSCSTHIFDGSSSICCCFNPHIHWWSYQKIYDIHLKNGEIHTYVQKKYHSVKKNTTYKTYIIVSLRPVNPLNPCRRNFTLRSSSRSFRRSSSLRLPMVPPGPSGALARSGSPTTVASGFEVEDWGFLWGFNGV